MINSLLIPSVAFSMYENYIDLAKYYLNATITSVPIRYLNIDVENSIYDESTLTSFDQFKSSLTGLKYNLYEYTPAYYSSPQLYTTMYEMDKDGSRFSTSASISIYTIPKVYIGDLVQFYSPNEQKTLFFRVVNFRTPLNTMGKLPIFDIDLEPAPIDAEIIDNTLQTSINIINRYIYDYSKEEYILLDIFELKYKIINILNDQFKKFIKSKIVSNELLQITYNGENYIFYEINKWIYELIALVNKKFSHINIPIPFGYKFILSKIPPQIVSVDSYTTLNTYGGILNSFGDNEYTQIDIQPSLIDFSLIESNILNDTFDINNYDSDISKIIIMLYLIDKINT